MQTLVDTPVMCVCCVLCGAMKEKYDSIGIVTRAVNVNAELKHLDEDRLSLASQTGVALEAVADASGTVAQAPVGAHGGLLCRQIGGSHSGDNSGRNRGLGGTGVALAVATSDVARLALDGDLAHVRRVGQNDRVGEAITITSLDGGVRGNVHRRHGDDDVQVLQSGLGLNGIIDIERTRGLPAAVQILNQEHSAAVERGASGARDGVENVGVARVGGRVVDGEGVITAGAHAQGAVVALPAAVALAALDLDVVPVGAGVGAGKLADVLAGTVAGALVGALHTLASSTVEAVVAHALTSLAVAHTLVGALSVLVRRGSGSINPSLVLLTHTLGAVGTLVAAVARALVVLTAGTTARAVVGAGRHGHASAGHKGQHQKRGLHCFSWAICDATVSRGIDGRLRCECLRSHGKGV